MLNPRPFRLRLKLSIVCLVSLWTCSLGLSVGSLGDKSDKSTSFEDLNFTFETPGWPWVSITPTTLSEDATLAYRKTINDAYFIIIGEKMGVEYGFTTDVLVESAKTNMKGLSPDAYFGESESVEINGIEWTCFTGNVKLMGSPLVYGYLVYSGNGFGYQLVTWRAGDSNELVKSDVLELGKKFKLIDPDLITNSEDFEPIGLLKNEAAGLEVDLEGDGWTTWSLGEIEFPQASLTATKQNDVFLFAIPLYHKGLNPSFKDLKNSLLASTFDVDPNNGFIARDKIVRLDGNRVLQSTFSFENYAGDLNSFLIQIRKFKGFSYMTGGYSIDKSRLSEVETALQKIQISETVELEQAIESYSPEIRYFQSQALNQLAISAYSQNNYIHAKRYLEKSLEFDKNDPMVATNYAVVVSDQNDFQSIVDLYDSSPADFEDNIQFLEYYALALFRVDQPQKAEEIYVKIVDSGNMSEAGLWSYMELLAIQERWREGVEVAEDFAALTGSQNARQWAASFYSELLEFDKALELLNELKDEKPFDLSVDYEIAFVYLTQEKYTKTLDYLDDIGDDIDSYPLLHTLKGNAQFGLKSYVKAKETYQYALELNPLDEEAKTMLEYATLALGKGDTNVNHTPIEPVAIADVLSAKAKEIQDNHAESEESEILHTLLAIHYEKDKINRKTRTTKVVIRDDSGLDAYSTLSFSFDPFYEQVYVNEITVRDLEGNVIGQELRDDFYILDNSSDTVVSQERSLYAPVSGLTKNSTIEYTVTYDTIGLIEEFPLSWQNFTYQQNSLICGVSVTGETDSVSHFASEGVVFQPDENALIWYAENVPNYKIESFQADIESFAPYLVLAEKSLSWDKEAKEYLVKIADRLTTSDEIAGVAKSLVGTLDTDEEKLRAIYRYIQREFTYKALSFGPRAQVPNTADQIVADKYGDCKDLALLANRLLESVGIKSHLALVNTRSLVQTQLPSLDQFDHMILYLPDYNGGHFIDCTSQHISLDHSVPLGLEERQILVLEESDPRFVKTGPQVLEENTISSERVIEFVDNDLLVEETLLFTGLPAAYFRSYLSTLQDSQILDTFQMMMLSKVSQDLRLEKIESLNVEEPGEPLKVLLSYSISRAIKKTGDGFTLASMPSVWEQYYLSVPFVRNRQTPFKIRNPIAFDSSVTVIPPKGAWPSRRSLNSMNKESTFHIFRHNRVIDEKTGEISVESYIKMLPNGGSHDLFSEFQDSAQDALSLLGDSLEFESIE